MRSIIHTGCSHTFHIKKQRLWILRHVFMKRKIICTYILDTLYALFHVSRFPSHPLFLRLLSYFWHSPPFSLAKQLPRNIRSIECINHCASIEHFDFKLLLIRIGLLFKPERRSYGWHFTRIFALKSFYISIAINLLK